MIVMLRTLFLIAAVFLCVSLCLAADYDCPQADVSGDCKVDLCDFAMIALAWMDGPMCPADYEDCDGIALNACEAHLLTDYHNCGACGNSCADFPGTFCQDGECVPFICPDKWADCDSDPNNGCETNLAQFSNTCNSSHNFGFIKGDIGSDQVQYTGHGNRWFKVFLIEADFPGDSDISVTVELGCPEGTDYNMDVYMGGCPGVGSLIYIFDDVGDDGGCLCWDDWSGSDDTKYLYFRVYVQSGTSCDDFTLTLTGNTGCGFCM